MKKQLIIISALLFSLSGFSQGIEFEHGTWKEVLQKAQQSNKPIFIDVYTSWCGPCKKMSKDIFPLTEVGKVYNANFICYQIDAEKGDGIEIAKKYEVKAYPTYLFLKNDGTLFSKLVGSMEVEKFIAISKTALTDMNDPKSIAMWEKEYVEKKNDPAFLLDYMNKRSKLGKSNNQLFDEYLKSIPEERRTSDTIVELYKKEERYLNVNSLAYTNLQKNQDKFVSKIYGLVYVYLADGVMNSLHEAAKLKDSLLLATTIQAYDLLSPYMKSLKSKNELYMEYYKQVGDSEKYLKYATDFCNNQLMKISKDSIDKKDLIFAKMIEKQINSGALAKLDSTQLAQLKEQTSHTERDRISLNLNNIAWDIFEKVSNKNVLKDALRWSGRSLELSPNKAPWLDTYANLLYKLGQKKEAIAKEEVALHYANTEEHKWFEKTLAKMKSGENTWEN